MIHSIADDVHQGIADLFEDGLVELDSLALDDQPDLFALRAREVPHQTWESLEDCLDRQHANRHDARLQLFGNTGDVGARLFQVLDDQRALRAVIEFLDEDGERPTGHQHLADNAHQTIQLILVDANRRGRGGNYRLFRLRGRGDLGGASPRGLSEALAE